LCCPRATYLAPDVFSPPIACLVDPGAVSSRQYRRRGLQTRFGDAFAARSNAVAIIRQTITLVRDLIALVRDLRPVRRRTCMRATANVARDHPSIEHHPALGRVTVLFRNMTARILEPSHSEITRRLVVLVREITSRITLTGLRFGTRQWQIHSNSTIAVRRQGQLHSPVDSGGRRVGWVPAMREPAWYERL
jgi:hypothetical protein